MSLSCRRCTLEGTSMQEDVPSAEQNAKYATTTTVCGVNIEYASKVTSPEYGWVQYGVWML